MVDLVADRAHLGKGVAGGVGEVPVELALAEVDRAGVPTPMVMTTSAVWTASSGQRLGELAGWFQPHLCHGCQMTEQADACLFPTDASVSLTSLPKITSLPNSRSNGAAIWMPVDSVAVLRKRRAKRSDSTVAILRKW